MKNLKEYKELAERYATITLQEIDKSWEKNGHHSARNLTGFGNMNACTLCVVVNRKCTKCVYKGKDEGWFVTPACIKKSKTYSRVSNAITPQELLQAFRARAKYMKQKIRRIENRK